MARVSLKDRRAAEAKGVDALIPEPDAKAEAPAQEAERRPALSKVTVYVRPDQVLAIEAIQLTERERTGKRPDKSQLVQEALDLLAQKYGKA